MEQQAFIPDKLLCSYFLDIVFKGLYYSNSFFITSTIALFLFNMTKTAENKTASTEQPHGYAIAPLKCRDHGS